MIRTATADDLPLVRELWEEFSQEVPDEPWREVDSDEDLAELEAAVEGGIVLIAEQDGAATGLAVLTRRGPKLGFVDVLYVRSQARRGGVARELVRELTTRLQAEGIEMLELEVLASNEDARAVYERWGLQPVELVLGAGVDDLAARLEPPAGPTYGAVHVQTDDVDKVQRDAVKVLRAEPDVQVGNGWVRVRSEATDADPERLKTLARELSFTIAGVTLALGVERGSVVRYHLYDRGSDVDEYLSVPEFYGPLPPGDVYALGANPTVIARLTGADARRVREVARTGATTSDLPPAEELYREIAAVLGVEP
jgi:[ribosomal protein S18]-alanine N-acetyltransferase